MENINIKLDKEIAIMVAMERGWLPKIEDTTKEMVGDEYPIIDNPLTYQMFLSTLIPEFIKEFVLKNGREKLKNEFNSITNSVQDKVQKGDFDSMILLGDFDEIKRLVKENL